MVLALVSCYQQQKFLSLAELDLDAVAPPKLQGIDIPSRFALCLVP